MYLDTNNFIRELPCSTYTYDNNRSLAIGFNNRYYLLFNILKYNKTVEETVRVFELLSLDNSFVMKAALYALFLEHKDINAVYTKLDLNQTFSQVRRNKYFKVAFGKRQLISEE